jgi:hypothetical protein
MVKENIMKLWMISLYGKTIIHGEGKYNENYGRFFLWEIFYPWIRKIK